MGFNEENITLHGLRVHDDARFSVSEPPVSLLKTAFLKIILLHQKRKYQSDPIRSPIRSPVQSGPVRSDPIRSPLWLTATKLENWMSRRISHELKSSGSQNITKQS